MSGQGSPAALGAALAGELTFLALCWRIVRSDGVALGFTTHDAPLWVGGLRHASAPGMAPSAVVSGSGLDADTMEIEGGLSSAEVTAADLAAGRYDGAAVRLTLVDWRDPDGGAQLLAQGTIGAVAIGSGADAGFTATLRGPTAVLEAVAVEAYSPECRAELGDARCRVALRGRSRRGHIAANTGNAVAIEGLGPDDVAFYTDGRLRLLDGADAGTERRIIGSDAERLLLDTSLSAAIGVAVEILQGCDKRFATCRDRFANAANFRGEPHVPGGDLLTRFGGL